MRLRTVVALLAVVGVLSLVGASTSAAPASSVPAEYADLYTVLERQLRTIDRYVTSRDQAGPRSVLFSAELLAANANIGERLLSDEAWQAVVFNLDRLQLLGVRAVKVAIKYPVLVPGFPRSAAYLEFYRRLGQELRRRDLKMLAQMTNGFREAAFSQLPVDSYYAALTWERFTREKRQQAETIIREVRPDFLTVENEPGTQQANTGLSFTPQAMAELVQSVLEGLDRQRTLVGAGTGTWDDLAYMQALSRTPVDYLDMHIYPVTRDFVVDRAFRIADIARRANKKLFLGEAWLYKAADRELGGAPVAAAPVLFARDVYSFWEPLDVEFLQVMAKLSRALPIDFTSFFWSRYFFGYVAYSSATRGLPPAQLFQLANRAAAANMMAAPPRLTRTGEAFQRLNRTGF